MSEFAEKNSWFTQCASYDICFCMGECQNFECSRNPKRLQDLNQDYGWHSFADLTNECDDYKPPKVNKK